MIFQFVQQSGYHKRCQTDGVLSCFNAKVKFLLLFCANDILSSVLWQQTYLMLKIHWSIWFFRCNKLFLCDIMCVRQYCSISISALETVSTNWTGTCKLETDESQCHDFVFSDICISSHNNSFLLFGKISPFKVNEY